MASCSKWRILHNILAFEIIDYGDFRVAELHASLRTWDLLNVKIDECGAYDYINHELLGHNNPDWEESVLESFWLTRHFLKGATGARSLVSASRAPLNYPHGILNLVTGKSVGLYWIRCLCWMVIAWRRSDWSSYLLYLTTCNGWWKAHIRILRCPPWRSISSIASVSLLLSYSTTVFPALEGVHVIPNLTLDYPFLLPCLWDCRPILLPITFRNLLRDLSWPLL